MQTYVRFVSKDKVFHPYHPPARSHTKDEYSDAEKTKIVNDYAELEVKEKSAFKEIIIEKLKCTVISNDVIEKIRDALDQPPKGYQRWHLLSDNLDGIIPKFICNLCCQFAKRPIRCARCEWIYCRDCQQFLNELPGKLNLVKPESVRSFLCIGSCIENYGSDYSQMTYIPPDAHNEYESVLFHCRKIFCKFFGRPDAVFRHENECVLGPTDWSFDVSFMKNDYGGEVYKKYIEEHPLRVEDILVPARRRAEFIKGQHDFFRFDMMRIWVMSRYPGKERSWYSSVLETSTGWKDAVRQDKYKDGILSDGETLSQSWGLPFYKPSEEMLRMNIQPLPDPKIPVKYPSQAAATNVRRQYVKRPAAAPLNRGHPEKRATWSRSNGNYRSRPLSPSGSTSSRCSRESSLSIASKYLPPDTPRAFTMKLIWEDFSEEEKEEFKFNLTFFPSHGDNQPKIPQPHNPSITDEERAERSIRDNRRALKQFEKRPNPIHRPLPAYSRLCIDKNREAIKNEDLPIIGFSLEWATTRDGSNFVTSPIWIVIIDHQNEIIYESLVKQTNIHEMCDERHGITPDMLGRQRSFSTVRTQVLNYLIAAKIIVGAGLRNHLTWLGLTQHEITMLTPKLRDMNWSWSPKRHSSCNLAVNAFIAFKRRIIDMHRCHPYSMAFTAMSLYLMGRGDIEKGNLDGTRRCNEIAENNLRRFLRQVDAGIAKWPEDWRRPPYEAYYKFPTLEDFDILHFDPEDEEEAQFRDPQPSTSGTTIEEVQSVETAQADESTQTTPAADTVLNEIVQSDESELPGESAQPESADESLQTQPNVEPVLPEVLIPANWEENLLAGSENTEQPSSQS